MAYIPTTPLPVLPAPTAGPLPSWIGPTTQLGFLTALAGGVVNTVFTGLAASRYNLRPAASQGVILHSAVNTVLGAIPGVNLLTGFAGLVGLAFRGNLEEYKRRERIENPNYAASTDLSGLQSVIDQYPEDAAKIEARLKIRERQRLVDIANRVESRRLEAIAAQRPTDVVGFDPRTGAAISRRTLDLETSPGRVASVRATEARQRLPFFGLPSIFTRRRLN